MPYLSSSSRISLAMLAALSLSLAGCASLPSSGPTGAQIVKAQQDATNPVPFKIVELNDLAALPASSGLAAPGFMTAAIAPRPSDLIGPGDVLNVVIYEAGVTVFSGSNAKLSEVGGYDPSAHAERLPALRVSDDGYINLPYVGRIKAAGLTPEGLQRAIVGGLGGKSQNPQVIVSIEQSITNSVILGGEVAKSGRLMLSTGKETLLDVVALAGGYRGEASDLALRLERDGRVWETRLAPLLRSDVANLRILPGDHLELLRQPQSFSVFGAPGKVEQIPFAAPSMSLSEAMARAGGSNPYLGDPAAIFVFRFVQSADGGKEEPVVYHLNMQKAGSYFVAQRFAMNDKDILYVGNARANQPSKFIQLISQLFTPIATARLVTQ